MNPRDFRFTRWLAPVLLASVALAAASPALAQKIWSGLGDGTSWSDNANWVGGAAPVGSDLVLLDNSVKATSYTVILPGGAVTTSVVRLTIAPGASRTVTLILPVANTAVPGLRAGDATPATNDIVLQNGAILINRSGAASGNGIEANSLANGTVRIENGARYLHNTARSTAGVVPLLSTAAGTELGEFEYDSPGTGSIAIGASGRTYGSLTLTRSAGPATYTASGGSPLTVRGDFTVNAGVSYTSGMTGAMYVRRNWANNGIAVILPSGQSLIPGAFDTSASFSGTGMNTFNGGMSIDAGVSVSLSARVAITGLTNNGSLTVASTLEIDGGSVIGNPLLWLSGDLLYDTSVSYVVNAGDAAWPASNGPSKVTVRGAGITLNVPRTVMVMQAYGIVWGQMPPDPLTVTDTLQLNAGASFQAPPTYGPDATLVYSTGNWNVGPEWTGGSGVGSGVPRNVTIDAGAGNTVALPAADRTIPGVLTLSSGTLVLNPTTGDLHLGDDLIPAGMDTTAANLQTNGRTLILDGNIGTDSFFDVSFELSSLHLSLDHLRLVDAQVTLHGSNASVDLAPPNGGESLRLQGNSQLNLNGNTLRFAGAASTLAVANGTRTISGPGTIEVTSPLTVADAGSSGALSFQGEFSPTINIVGTSLDAGAELTTIDGAKLVMKSGGSVANNHPPTYTNGATLAYDTGGQVVRGTEWSSDAGPGYPDYVQVVSGTTLVLGGSVPSKTRHDLRVDAGASLTANPPGNPMTGPLTIGGALTANGPITMSTVGGADWFVNGDISVNVAITQNGRKLVLSGDTGCSYHHVHVLNDLVVAKGGAALVVLDTDLTIANSIELDNGGIDTGFHKVVILPNATVTRTNGAILGNLQKHLAPTLASLSADGSLESAPITFEVGSASGYAPVDVTYDHVASPAELTVSTRGGEHADAVNSGIDVTRDVNRSWSLSLSRAPDPSESFTATFHWQPGDKDPGSDFQLFDVYAKSASWTRTPGGVRATDHVTAANLRKYGDYIVGTPSGLVDVPRIVPGVTFMRPAGPNPFHDATAIAYGLSRAGHLRVEVFSITGQRVRTLVDRDEEPGSGSARWDGRDDGGNAVAPGVYIARMETTGQRFTLPLSLLR